MSAQLKPANRFQLETRPAPPVYQPHQANTSSQPKLPASSAQPQAQYQLSSPVWVGNGRQQIRVTAKGSPMPIGSVDVHYKQGGKAFISDLAVAQSHRRHGVGTMLMKAAMDAAQRNGSSATELEARPGPGSISNQALSGMYQKLGFRNAGTTARGNPKMLANAAVQQKPAMVAPVTAVPSLSGQNPGSLPAITRYVMQPCSGFPKPASPLPWVIQRAAMEIETKDEESESETELEDGVRVEKSSTAAVSKAILTEIEKIIKAASDKGGGERDDHGGLAQLTTILADKAVTAAKPKNSEGTYAIGSDGATLYLTGTQKFVTAAKTAAGDGVTTQDIGARDDFIHGESHLVQSKPAIKSVAATQPNCLFCYGFLETKKLDHQQLRAKPFPKGWIHPVSGFKLTNVNPNNGPKGALLWITFNGAERLYRVD